MVELSNFAKCGKNSKNVGYGHLESNGLIGAEIDEFRQKLKKLEFWPKFELLEVPGCYWDRFRII